MVESGRPLPLAELSLMRKDGSRVSVYSSHVIVPVAGHTPELFCLDLDLTQRKQAEKALETANTELQAALIREKELAHTDMLTGVNNRRNLYEVAAHELDIAIRYRQPLSLLMFDLDHFKQVNDTFGHTVGDQILVQVTQAACAELRSADAIGRYGGDEFIVILKDTSEHDLIVIAKRILTTVKNSTYINGLVNTDITLSIGISSGRLPIVQLIKQADDAMYKSKELGKDRYSIYNNQA